MITKMNVKINPEDSVNVTNLVSFYDNVAKTLGIDIDAVRYDCTKIDVSRNIQNNIFGVWEKMGASNLEIGMTWCNSGPKTYDELPDDTIRISHGFLLNENDEPLPFEDFFDKSSIAPKHHIPNVPYALNEAQKLVDGKAVEQKQENQSAAGKYYIEGETRVVKDRLKALGCKWDRDRQQWYHTDPAKAKEAQKLVNDASGPTGVGTNELNRGTGTPESVHGVYRNPVSRDM